MFSNVGDSGLLAIISISLRLISIPLSIASFTSLGVILSNAGTPPNSKLLSDHCFIIGFELLHFTKNKEEIIIINKFFIV